MSKFSEGPCDPLLIQSVTLLKPAGYFLLKPLLIIEHFFKKKVIISGLNI